MSAAGWQRGCDRDGAYLRLGPFEVVAERDPIADLRDARRKYRWRVAVAGPNGGSGSLATGREARRYLTRAAAQATAEVWLDRGLTAWRRSLERAVRQRLRMVAP